MSSFCHLHNTESWVLPFEGLFWERVDRAGDHWLWTGAKNEHKYYGVFYHAGKKIRAHRAAYIFQHGPVPAGLNVLHHCDVGLCVRGKCLYAGTQKQNMRDRIAHGKGYASTQGVRNGRSKLTDETIVVIRNAYSQGQANTRELAERFAVSQGLISKIIRRVAWQHVR